MCIFSKHSVVSKTRIFARMTQPQRQVLVYQMKYQADMDLAMILPIPIVQGTKPEFLNFETYKDFFYDLAKAENYGSRGLSKGRSFGHDTLEVVEVGAYDASFVPDFASFERLDPRFRLKPGLLESVPGYDQFGFVVFKLNASSGRDDAHPMAFEFDTQLSNQLFYPTVHIHDETWHDKEQFDHTLYSQNSTKGHSHQISREGLEHCMQANLCQGVIDFTQKVDVHSLYGMLPNTDKLVPVAQGAVSMVQ